MARILPLSDKLWLVHDPAQGEGKTRYMAKGPFLCFQNTIFAGESAGLGLPVFKTKTRTVFPSLISSKMITNAVLEVIYRLDLVVQWRVMGISRSIAAFDRIAETLARVYMNRSGMQQFLLALRKILFDFFNIQCHMVPGSNIGWCKVEYEPETENLCIRVDASNISDSGELILLNEADGVSFTRFKIGDRILEKNQIPAWNTWPAQTRVASPTYHIVFSVLTPNAAFDKWELGGGREVSSGLNWAGLALKPDCRVFRYEVLIRRP